MLYGGFPRKATTYSPTNAVPSALTGLTSLFGMVRGEPRRYNHLKFWHQALSALALALMHRAQHGKYLNILKQDHELIISLKKNRRTISLWVISTTRL